MSAANEPTRADGCEPRPEPSGGGLPAILAVAGLAFRESARNRVLHALVAATLLACGSSYLFSYVSGGDGDPLRHRKVVLDLSLTAITVLGTLAVIFLGTNLIYQEVERRTIYSVLARPISRPGFLLGKYLGLAAVLGAALAAMSAGFLLLFALGGGTVTPSILLALAMIYVELLVVLGVALFLSVATHPIEGAVIAFVVAVTGHVTQNLNDLGRELTRPRPDFQPGAFEFALQKFLWVIYVLFPNLEFFNLKSETTYGLPIDPGRVGLSLVYAVVYVVIMLAASSLVFRRRIL
ncbi:MAG: ABC transporter permease [Planctomycetota bacterium]|nr:MAG: ABC transporter permease [Planctomycetota bacterium]